ncbi:MAG: O-antigen ligase family protein [Candidatus Magasanikbacteria bacterium]|nr:O-antigen ligase family protein [Candidatus Magasanikbacteria bacterium]
MHHWIIRYEKQILNVTRWLLVASLLTPLVFIPEYFIFPFITVKVFYLRAVIVLAFGGYLALLMVRPATYRPPRSVLIMAVVAFFTWTLISAVFGADPYHSFFSDHERMLGLLTMTHYVLLLIMFASIFRDTAWWKKIFLALVGAGALVLVGALIQQFNPDFLYGGDRAASTLGNPTYLSVYAVYVGVLAWYVLRTAYRNRFREGAFYFLIITIALSIGGFVWSETRGAFIGLGAAVVGMCVLSVVVSGRARNRRIGIGLLAVMSIAATLIVFGAQRGQFSETPIVRRFGDFSITGASETRLRTWSIALDAWRARPITGWGWFNFAIPYNEYYRPEQLKHGLGETWVDQAHNTVLETLATTGSVGLLLYLLIWVAVGYLLWSGYRTRRIGNEELVLFSGLLIFHFVQNIFVFENPSSYVTLFVVFAFLIHRTQETVVVAPLGRVARWFTPVRGGRSAAIAVVLAVILAYYVNVVPARANHLQILADEALARGDAGFWWGIHQQALALPTPHRDDIRREMARTFMNTSGITQLPKDALDQIMTFILGEMEKTVRLHPKNVRIALEYGEALLFQYEHLRDVHPDAALRAERVYEQARALSPQRQQVLLLHASAVMEVSDFQRVKSILQEARALSPSLPIIHRLLGEFFEKAGLHEDALASYETAIRLVGTPEQVFGSLDEWQRFGLLHIEYGNPLRGAWALDQVMSCTTGRVTWRECAEGTSPFFATFRPSRKAFTALILYYGKTGEASRRDFYQGLAKEYYADFEMPR